MVLEDLSAKILETSIKTTRYPRIVSAEAWASAAARCLNIFCCSRCFRSADSRSEIRYSTILGSCARIGSGTDGRKHEVVAVNLNWNDDEWNSNAYRFDDDNDWNEGNIFLSFETARETPRLCPGVLFCAGELRINAILPAAQNFADFDELLGD